VFRLARFVEPDKGPQTTVTIHADGRVVAEVPEGLLSLAPTDLTKHVKNRVIAEDPDVEPEPLTTKVLEGKLSAKELQELLRFALHEQECFDFDEAAVTAAIRDRYKSDGSVRDSTDSTTTAFRVQTAEKSHEVSWTRLTKAAWDFPEV